MCNYVYIYIYIYIHPYIRIHTIIPSPSGPEPHLRNLFPRAIDSHTITITIK